MVHTEAAHGAATVLRALAAVRDGELAQARTILEDLPGHGLGKLVHPMLSAWIALAEGKNPDNVADLADLNAIDGIDLLRRVHSALIHDLSGRPKRANAAFDTAIEKSDGLSLRLAWLAANFYARAGEPERARAVIDGYRERNPGSTTADLIAKRVSSAGSPAPLVANAEQGLAEALFNVAGLLNQQGATDLALLYAQLSLYMHEDFAFGRMLLGEILTNQGRSDAAIAAYETVPSDSPFAYVAKLRVASALQELGKPDAAIGMLRTVADAHPDRYEPMYRIGNVHRSEEAFADAATAYRGALDRLGATNQQHWSLHYFLGIALERTDQWADAEAQFKRALELRPEQPYVMNYLAYSWVEQETNLEQAQTMLKQAVEQRPEDGFIVDSMGWVHYRLGHYDKAVRYLERAVELRPADPVINDHLGDAYWKVGRKREARFQWHRALSLDPDADVESRIETKLEQGLDAVDKAADG
jgi:tetratricopeptide (TPR) repeat protein